MSSSLLQVWEGASPFEPAISKDSQFLVGTSLLSFALLLTVVFTLNRSFINLPILGLPASIAFGFGAVYMICAVGVYLGMPIFLAVANSARQLFLLLRCLNFASKAQVQISKEGLRFSVEEARVLQGLAFLDKALFTTYHFDSPPATDANDDPDYETEPPTFQVSLPALLETLQIFGVADGKDKWSAREAYTSGVNGTVARGENAFDNRVLGMSGICRISYNGLGDPLCIVLQEGNVTTTCELVTYESESFEDIPFDRDNLVQKIIMRASVLHDAISELGSTSADRLTIATSLTAPNFSISATGPLGSATIEFSNDPQLLETFQASRRAVNTYKVSLIKAAARAMFVASKVSIRGDAQGVLSLQFMIEGEYGHANFVDFRIVPFVPDEDDENEMAGSDEAEDL